LLGELAVNTTDGKLFLKKGDNTIVQVGGVASAGLASATATGTTGDIVHDTNYIYVCIATNTWKRVAITTW